MTLILSFISKDLVVQVGDRLVTKGKAPWDPQANKALLCEAKDGFVSIGYSGLALVDGKPTDWWIAELLRGRPIAGREPGKPAAISVGACKPWLDIGSATRKLQTELERRVSRIQVLEIFICGWQQKRNHWRPIWVSIKTEGESVKVAQSERGEYWTSGEPTWSLGWIPDSNLAPDDLKDLHATIRRHGPDPQAIMTSFQVAIRLAAGRNPLVGEDCTALIIPRPDLGDPSFIPLPKDNGSSVWTPWVVRRNVVLAPSEVHGETSIEVADSWVGIGPPTPGRRGALSSQRRRLH